MPIKPKAVSRLRLVWLGCWFADIVKRRVGWRTILRPTYYHGRAAREWRIGPLLIFWHKPLRYREMLWLQEDGLHAPKP